MPHRLKLLRTTHRRVERERGCVPEASVSVLPVQSERPPAAAGSSDSQRSLLSSVGARLRARLSRHDDHAALAILDANGLVVFWHDGLFGMEPRGAAAVPGRHFSQFYLAGDIAMGFLKRSLRCAEDIGSDTRQGWRRKSSGGVFWGTTVIEPIGSQGSLLGFTHVTRCSPGSWELLLNAVRPNRPRVHAREWPQWSHGAVGAAAL